LQGESCNKRLALQEGEGKEVELGCYLVHSSARESHFQFSHQSTPVTWGGPGIYAPIEAHPL